MTVHKNHVLKRLFVCASERRNQMKQDVIYEKVAERCSSFNAISKDSYTNRAKDTENVSCKNCSHFEKEHCVLDLYDKIVDSNNLTAE